MPSGVLPLWRFLVTDLDGKGITLLDHLASERMVTLKLNEAAEVTGTVPSDSNYVNRLHTDGFPLLAEGVRQLYCFRRESNTPPYYTIRASTLIMQIDDAAASDDARSRFTAWDPWQYMMMRPVLQSSNATGGTYTDGALIGPNGLIYGAAQTAGEIALDILNTSISYCDITAPAAAQTLFLRNYTDDGNTGSFGGSGYPIQQGTSVGQALQDLCATGYMDILLTPVYDSGNPGALCDLDVLSQSAPYLGAGVFNYNAIFAWDMPGRSVAGVDDLFDGLGRANVVQFYNGQGGSPVTQQKDASSIVTYGEYWAQQWFPAIQKSTAPVVAMAEQQLGLRKTVKQTLAINPAPTRAPEPFVDYGLGDRVPVWASNRLRQAVGEMANPDGIYNSLYAAKGCLLTTSDLYSVNPSTAACTSIGAIGYAISGMTYHPVKEIMYAATSAYSAASPNSLIRIDLATGAGTVIGPLGINADSQIGDLTVRPDGVLMGLGEMATGSTDSGVLFTINTTTGAATQLDPLSASGGACALVYSPFYGWLYPFTSSDEILRVNPYDGTVLYEYTHINTDYLVRAASLKYGFQECWDVEYSGVLGTNPRLGIISPLDDDLTPPSNGANTTLVGTMDVGNIDALAWVWTQPVYQRIYGIPVEIDDNGTETVRELLVGIVGAP